ncbi:hypothetical protein BDV12DRAFT_209107 [Aspergillus spectabilis]
MMLTTAAVINESSFTGYQWTYFSYLVDNSIRPRVQHFHNSVDWDALLKYATVARSGIDCKLLPDIGIGYNHMVRIIEFTDNIRWVARLRMPLPAKRESDSVLARIRMEREYNIIQLVRRETKIPTPEVHVLELESDSVKAPFMLMDCLRGNVGMDLSMKIPPEHKLGVFTQMAAIHIEMFNIRLPKIGTIIGINEDGSYEQGAIPGLGGPFDTATEFFQAWATKIEFGLSEAWVKESAGKYADEVLDSMSSFLSLMQILAGKLSRFNNGPFPLCHGDFGHNNIVFDDNYHLLGVIDWESAFAAPCEIAAEFPLTLSIIPPTIDVPWNYDEAGFPKDPDHIERLADRERYIAILKGKEEELGLSGDFLLSTALQDSKRQDLVATMGLYETGKPAWYAKIMDGFLEDIYLARSSRAQKTLF